MVKSTNERMLRINPPNAGHEALKSSVESQLAPVVWVGWQIRPGERYFGIVQRADGTVERTRLDRDDLKAAADFVTAHKMGKGGSIRGRKLRRLH